MTGKGAKIGELLAQVGTNVDAGNELLRIAAIYFKAHEPLPDDLADYLARAFDRAVSASDDGNGRRVDHDRISRLAHALGLSRNEGRPRIAVSKFDVAVVVAQHGEAFSETMLKRTLAEAYGISLGTARTRIKETKRGIAKAHECFAAIMAANDLESLVEPRGGECVRR